ncbi:MAG: S8 family peptidase [Flavobacterium sp.]
MRVLFLLAVLVFGIFLSEAQNRKGQFLIFDQSAPHELLVSFEPQFFDNNRTIADLDYLDDWQALKTDFNFELVPSFQCSEEQWQSWSQHALKYSGSVVSVERLKYIYRLELPEVDNNTLLELAEKIESFSFVTYASLVSTTPETPPFDIPPVTPNFQANQTYIGPDPGLNVQHAWNMNLFGQGIRVRDIEYGFNKNHEELHQVNCFVAPNMNISSAATESWTEHGTPVFGIIMAHNGDYGVTGLTHSVQEMVLFPEWQQSGWDRANAVFQSILASNPGDIILYEMQQTAVPTNQNSFVPAEFRQDIWDLTKAATDAGIVIVAAAGNGNQNLNSSFYQPYINRGDSGAIIVGGGRSTTAHNRASGSTHGDRVDVQGWYENVFTSGYGNIIQIGGDFNQGYTNFSGTSSATPMVAACAILVQQYHYQLTGEWLTSQEIRHILKTTGIPQTFPPSGNIGPFPNMEAALQMVYTNYLLSLPESETRLDFRVFPNPFKDEVSFMWGNELSESATLELFNALGQQVYHCTTVSLQSLQLSHLTPGMYFIKVSDGLRSGITKVIKK